MTNEEKLAKVGTMPECRECGNLEICCLVKAVIALADKRIRDREKIIEKEVIHGGRS